MYVCFVLYKKQRIRRSSLSENCIFFYIKYFDGKSLLREGEEEMMRWWWWWWREAKGVTGHDGVRGDAKNHSASLFLFDTH